MLDWRMSSRLNRWKWLKLTLKFTITSNFVENLYWIMIWPHVIWSYFTFTRWSQTFLRCWRSTQGCIIISTSLQFWNSYSLRNICTHVDQIFTEKNICKYSLKNICKYSGENCTQFDKISRLTKGDDFRFAKLLLLLPVLRSIGLESPGSLFCNEATIADNFR